MGRFSNDAFVIGTFACFFVVAVFNFFFSRTSSGFESGGNFGSNLSVLGVLH